MAVGLRQQPNARAMTICWTLLVLADGEDLGVAVEAADGVFLDEAVTAWIWTASSVALTASLPVISLAWAAVRLKSSPRSFMIAAL